MAADVWIAVSPTDDRLRGLYMRHYSSKKATQRRGPSTPAQRRIVGPGECWAALTPDALAGFVWRWARYRQDDQDGVECTLFRNEGTSVARSSDLIRAAVETAQQRWLGLRLFTFVDPREIRSTNPGACFIAAGWRRLPTPTKRGLRVLEAPQRRGEAPTTITGGA